MDDVKLFRAAYIDLLEALGPLLKKHGPAIYSACLYTSVVVMDTDLFFDGVEIFQYMKKSALESLNAGG